MEEGVGYGGRIDLGYEEREGRWGMGKVNGIEI